MAFRFGLEFGWGADPIQDQLEAFGISDVDAETIEHWQKDADAILRCVMRDCLTPSEGMKARNRLTRKIEGELRDGGHIRVVPETEDTTNGQ